MSHLIQANTLSKCFKQLVQAKLKHYSTVHNSFPPALPTHLHTIERGIEKQRQIGEKQAVIRWELMKNVVLR